MALVYLLFGFILATVGLKIIQKYFAEAYSSVFYEYPKNAKKLDNGLIFLWFFCVVFLWPACLLGAVSWYVGMKFLKLMKF